MWPREGKLGSHEIRDMNWRGRPGPWEPQEYFNLYKAETHKWILIKKVYVIS